MNRRLPRKKKHFVPQGCRVVAGLHSCRETLSLRSKDIQEMWFKQKPQGHLLTLFQKAQNLGVKIVIPSLHHMDELCTTHQGIISFVSSSPELDWSSLKDMKKIQLIAVDGVMDPRNLGAIMRTAWLMGVPAILTSTSRTGPVSATVMKVACGAGEHVAIEECNHLNSLKEMGFWIYGLAGQATKNLWSFPLPEKVVWVVGSEERGLRPATRRSCDEMLVILQATNLASYNVSVAAALAMDEYRRRVEWVKK